MTSSEPSQNTTAPTRPSLTPPPPTTKPSSPAASPSSTNKGQYSKGVLKEDVVNVLKTCYDPEIPVNIYELGLIYNINVNDENHVDIDMTLTSPNCPAAESLPPEVQNKVKHIPGITGVQVKIVWEPTWDKSLMSEAAQLQLGLL